MKKIISVAALALSISVIMNAQPTGNNRRMNQENTHQREQKSVRVNTGAEQHGSAVSTAAKETPSGPGKGEIVSTQAKSQGEAKKAGKQLNKESEIQRSKERKGAMNAADTAGKQRIKNSMRPGVQGKK
jgi:hypothetical protein